MSLVQLNIAIKRKNHTRKENKYRKNTIFMENMYLLKNKSLRNKNF